MSKSSKFLSLILRHDPARFGVQLDSAGWTDVDALLAAMAAHGTSLTRDELAQLVRESDKQRFALSDDGTRIRANQGHSVEVDLQLPQVEPPEHLFHGTIAAALPAIRQTGLEKRARHHVHMSDVVSTASTVGMRRGAPIILTIRAREMAAAGHPFYRSANGVWLADHVPPQFIDEPDPLAQALADAIDGATPSAGHVAGDRRGARGGKIAIAQSTLAALDEGKYDLACVKNTIVYDAAPVFAASLTMSVSVVAESTLQAIARLGEPCCALNFASAKNPGGGFLGGAQAQEETLARSSGLYPCLTAHPEVYARQKAHRDAHYLDLVLYSPRVPFFRDDDGAWLDPIYASVITAPAPNAGALRQHDRFDAREVAATLHRRAHQVLAIAAHHGESRLILGAWGCGVFGNDPTTVAEIFQDLLTGEFRSAFAEVVFAVLPGPNLDAFAARF